MKSDTLFIVFILVLALTPCYRAASWLPFKEFVANGTSYTIRYYAENNYGAYGDARTIFTQITQNCTNVTLSGPNSDTPVFMGISSHRDVILYANRVVPGDGVQACISGYFQQGIANGASAAFVGSVGVMATFVLCGLVGFV